MTDGSFLFQYCDSTFQPENDPVGMKLSGQDQLDFSMFYDLGMCVFSNSVLPLSSRG